MAPNGFTVFFVANPVLLMSEICYEQFVPFQGFFVSISQRRSVIEIERSFLIFWVLLFCLSFLRLPFFSVGVFVSSQSLCLSLTSSAVRGMFLISPLRIYYC